MDIKYSKQVTKFLEKQTSSTKKRIINAIEKLPSGDVKKLKNSLFYRLRVGDFRIIFDRELNVICVLKIDNRGQVYKNLGE